jgi:hypothetical protein
MFFAQPSEPRVGGSNPSGHTSQKNAASAVKHVICGVFYLANRWNKLASFASKKGRKGRLTRMDRAPIRARIEGGHETPVFLSRKNISGKNEIFFLILDPIDFLFRLYNNAKHVLGSLKMGNFTWFEDFGQYE